MVEVFKTNINRLDHASAVISEIHKVFSDYVANFDLDDCDKILRVECESGVVQNDLLICLLKELGCEAQVLVDDPNSAGLELNTIEKQELIIH